ncbi:MAG: NAD-dependent epimerase/dehydratase family protein, partial [Spirochaetes bacterium]|nr:NAD-dependent epimerase/dehydratase family protein [Spirochaetota bacterium]
RISPVACNSTFISGGFGFLGQHIVKAVHDHDPHGDLRVLVRTPRRTLLGIESMPGVRLISGDLSRPETFAGEMEGVDTVIHSAALVSFKRWDEQALRRSNIAGTNNLLQAALDHQCRSFVFISSISAIGREAGRLSDETMIPDLEEKRCTDLYGYSKLVGERALQAQAHRMRVIILNPSVLLGPGSRFIEQIATLLRWIPVLPMLTTLNSFVDVRDVAHAVVLALTEGRSGERYIVTTENVDMLGFTRTVLAVMGKKVPVFPAPRSLLVLGNALVGLLDALHLNPGVRRIRDINVDKAYTADKIRREMGWLPAFSLEQSLRDTLSPFGDGKRR